MTQKTNQLLKCSWLGLVALLLATPVFAGGVVEELRTTPHALVTQDTKKSGELPQTPQTQHPNTPKDPDCNKNKGMELLSLFYDPIKQSITLRWKPFVHQGQNAIRYHIYRWTKAEPSRQLIGAVDGDIFEFVDKHRSSDESYFYNVVGIYNVDGQYETWQYPQLNSSEVQANQTEVTPAPVSLGVGCNTAPSAPSQPWLWLLVLPCLFWLRRRK